MLFELCYICKLETGVNIIVEEWQVPFWQGRTNLGSFFQKWEGQGNLAVNCNLALFTPFILNRVQFIRTIAAVLRHTLFSKITFAMSLFSSRIKFILFHMSLKHFRLFMLYWTRQYHQLYLKSLTLNCILHNEIG